MIIRRQPVQNWTTSMPGFVLMGFTQDPPSQLFLFVVFLFMYAVTLLGNLMIIILVKTNSHFNSPMYFFLSHLAFLDICFSSGTVPMLLANMCASQVISYSGCFLQMFCITITATTETLILTAMAYDRYAAICRPLHYVHLMDKTFCKWLIGGAWTISLFYTLVNMLPMLNEGFCGPNIIRHFSCELTSLLAISCSENARNSIIFLITGGIVAVFTFFVILLSYISIISSILKINSAEGKKKTFSTCSSHLIVVFLFYGTGCFRYMRPHTLSSVIIDEIFSIQYSISTPMLNPIIYSLTNREIKEAIKKLLRYKCLIAQGRACT